MFKIVNTFIDEKKFLLQNERDEQIIINFKISLQGKRNEEPIRVNVDLPLDSYFCRRLYNPFLNAQSDVFQIRTKVKGTNRTCGYIFPSSSLESDDEDTDENFDEAKQAFKFYAIKYLITNYPYDNTYLNREIGLSSIISDECSYIVVYKEILKDEHFSIDNWMPSLAIHGYLNFPENKLQSVHELINFSTDREYSNQIINSLYLKYKNKQHLTLKQSKKMLEAGTLINSLYMQYLIEAGNPLYRFLVLYQIIESLVEHTAKENLENVLAKRNELSTTKFIKEIHESFNTRATINKLFDRVVFDEKEEITAYLKGFITSVEGEYDKVSTGDCIYDIRNLIFHDYRSILTNPHYRNEIVCLVIQCEVLLHHLVIASSIGD